MFFDHYNAFIVTLIFAFYILAVQAQILGVVLIETQDIINVLFFIVLLILGRQEKWLWVGILLAFSVMNRETTLILLAPFSYLLLQKKNYGAVAWINLAGILSYLTIRLTISVKESDYPNFANLKTNFPIANGFLYKALEFNLHLFAFAAPLLFLTFYQLKSQTPEIRIWVATAVLFLAIHYIMGSIIELRLFLPLIVLILPIAMRNLKSSFEK